MADENSSGEGQHADPRAASATESVAETTMPKSEVSQAVEPGTTSVGALMDSLGIPESVRNYLSVERKTESSGGTGGPGTSDEAGETTETTVRAESDEAESVATTDTESGPEPDEAEQGPVEEAGTKPNKWQKRINRLTRQKSQLEEALDAKEAQLRELRSKLEGLENRSAPIPAGRGPLSYVADERQLAQEVQKAEALLEFCDEHPDGVTVDAGKETERFIEPGEIAKWRRAAEKTLLHAPLRRDEIRQYGVQRAKSDQAAMQICPQLFERGSDENKAAVALLQLVPEVASRPDINHLAALVIEGVKAVQARAARANGSSNGSPAKGIGARALGPRAPVAPHTANPPVERSESLSGTKRLKEAMDKLVAEPGTDRTKHIADVLGALDDVAGRKSRRAPAPS
jgi:hypothetical protein